MYVKFTLLTVFCYYVRYYVMFIYSYVKQMQMQTVTDTNKIWIPIEWGKSPRAMKYIWYLKS